LKWSEKERERERDKVQINYAFALMRKTEDSSAREISARPALNVGRKRQASHRVNRFMGRTGNAQGLRNASCWSFKAKLWLSWNSTTTCTRSRNTRVYEEREKERERERERERN